MFGEGWGGGVVDWWKVGRTSGLGGRRGRGGSVRGIFGIFQVHSSLLQDSPRSLGPVCDLAVRQSQRRAGEGSAGLRLLSAAIVAGGTTPTSSPPVVKADV